MRMNAEGNDGRQFALNVMHWLARARAEGHGGTAAVHSRRAE
jgi:hypothetical protein